MDIPVQVTMLFAAVFAVLQFPMGAAVGLYRAKTGIAFMDGGDEEMMRRMRAHGNFTENVPIALLVMAGAELAGGPTSLVIGIGGLLLVGRLLHYSALRKMIPEFCRGLGAGLTSLSMLVSAATIFVKVGGVV